MLAFSKHAGEHSPLQNVCKLSKRLSDRSCMTLEHHAIDTKGSSSAVKQARKNLLRSIISSKAMSTGGMLGVGALYSRNPSPE